MRRRLAGDIGYARHLLDAEIGSVLRRRVLRGELAPAAAGTLLLAAIPLIDHRREMTVGLARSAWALRANLSFHDALYAALAQPLSIPLLTADLRLARTALPCAVELAATA